MAANAGRRRREWTLAGMTFRTKEDVRRHVQAYINQTPYGDQVTDPVMLHLLRGNTEWQQKSAGMVEIVMAEITTRGTLTSKNALIKRADGSEAHISWRWPLEHLNPDGSFRQVDWRRDCLFRIKETAREAVLDQIGAARRRLDCPDGHEIDHRYPRTFDRLLFLFLKWWSVPLAEIEVESVEGSDRRNVFADWELEANWLSFHERVTRNHLRPLAPYDNQRAPKYPVDWSRLP